MLKKIAFYTLCIIALSHQLTLNGSDAAHAQNTDPSNSSENSDKKLWNVIMRAATKATTLIDPTHTTYATAGVAALLTAYSSYQLWRKFILDPQIQAATERMEKKIEQEMARHTEKINTHTSLEIQRSQQKQMEHTTNETHKLKTDLTQQINHTETKIALRIDSATQSTNTTMQTLHAKQNELHTKQNELHTQASNNHLEIMHRLNNSTTIRLPSLPVTSFTQLKRSPIAK